MVSTRPPTSKTSRPFYNPLVTVPKAPITIGTIVTLIFHSFFNSLARSRYLSFFSVIQFYSLVSRDSKVHNFASSLLFVDYYKVWSSGRDQVIRLYVKVPQEFTCVIFSDRFWVVHIPFVRLVKLNFLHSSQQITLPRQSCLVLYSFESFSHQGKLMVFHWSLKHRKSPQVSRTLLSIQDHLNNSVVWTVSNRSVISNYF